jgi:hypothetical protein
LSNKISLSGFDDVSGIDTVPNLELQFHENILAREPLNGTISLLSPRKGNTVEKVGITQKS